jgi:hypothetical protein
MINKFEAMAAAMAINLDASPNGNDNAPDGWSVDADRWFVRPVRPGDVAIPDDDQHYFGFVCERKVYVRRQNYCLDYDRGVITPWDGR